MARILFFGILSELASREAMETDAATLNEALAQAASRFPAISSVKYRVALNRELVRGNHALSPGDEIALMPPFAGG